MGQVKAAMKCDLPYVNAYRDRRGKWHYYFRRKGKQTRLRGVPGSLEFLKAYTDAKDGQPKPEPFEGIDPRSFEGLARAYKASAEFTQLAVSTKREMGYVITALCRDHGSKPVAMLGRRHIIEMKNALKHKPGACNKMLRTLKIILNYGVLAEYRTDNPADKIKLMKLGRHRAWNDQELAIYEQKWPLGTLERFIYDTALYSGQRASDLPKLLRSKIVLGRKITLVQQKTGKKQTLRIHTNWRASMDAYLPSHQAKTLIAGRQGEPIHAVTMAAIFRDAKRSAGLPEDCVLHGLRKTTARILAEEGQKSSPVTGHLTRAMQDEYERDADQEKMADAAIIKWEGRTERETA